MRIIRMVARKLCFKEKFLSIATEALPLQYYNTAILKRSWEQITLRCFILRTLRSPPENNNMGLK